METKASLDGLKMSSHFSKKAKEQVTGGSIKHVEDQLWDLKEKVNRFQDGINHNKEKINDIETRILLLVQHVDNDQEEENSQS